MNAVQRIDDLAALIALPRDITIPGNQKVRASLQDGGSTVDSRDSSARGEPLRPLLALASKIVEQGTCAKLVAQNGLYARLARLQLQHA